MNSRLHLIGNWQELGEKTNWSAAKLAEECNVSLRTLQRYFRQITKQSPQAWLSARRQQRAIELLRSGSTVKETAALLGYAYATHFSREFKRYWGNPPTIQVLLKADQVEAVSPDGLECRDRVAD